MKHNDKLLAYKRLNKLYFPVWQFKDNKVVSGFDILLKKLCDSTAIAKIRFFLLFNSTLGMTRIEALHSCYKLNLLIEKADCFDNPALHNVEVKNHLTLFSQAGNTNNDFTSKNHRYHGTFM